MTRDDGQLKRSRPRALLFRLLARHEPKPDPRHTAKAATCAVLAILLLGLLFDWTGLPLLIGPFGASTILLFARPEGVLAQPVNVLGGYLIAAGAALVTAELFPGMLWATAVSTGASLAAMATLRVTHPPAGAIPLIVFGDEAHVVELVVAVAVGGGALVAMALAVHRLPPRQPYPRRHPLDD
jgi:CBS-domain-containing membrane protein